MGERKWELGLGFKTGGEEKLERVVMEEREEVPTSAQERRSKEILGGDKEDEGSIFNERNVY